MSNFDKRRVVVTACAVLPVLGAARVFAQGAAVPRVGLLWLDEGTSAHRMNAFREGLRALGYVEGKNIQLNDRFLVKRYADLEQAAAKLVAEKVDIIFCWGSTATQAVAKATSTIPILAVMGSDPVKLGVAKSLANPGKNVTGVITLSEDLAPKRLELLKEAVPSLRRAGLLINPESAAIDLAVNRATEAAAKLKIEIGRLVVRKPEEIDSVLDGAVRGGVQGLVVFGGSMLHAHRAKIIAAAGRVRLPTMFSQPEWVDEGGLMAYSSNSIEDYRRIAAFVDKIIKGTPFREIPMEQSMRVMLSVNLKTAKALGIKLPQTVLVRANRVIE